MKKSQVYYDEMDKICNDYADQIKDEICEHLDMSNGFEGDGTLKYSIECMLNEMYEKIKPLKQEGAV